MFGVHVAVLAGKLFENDFKFLTVDFGHTSTIFADKVMMMCLKLIAEFEFVFEAKPDTSEDPKLLKQISRTVDCGAINAGKSAIELLN